MEQITISAKSLGEVALANFCPRCFWIKLKCGFKLPFQKFPGIFSSLDSYQKKITNAHFQEYQKLPFWYSHFGDLVKPIKAPIYHSFKIFEDKNCILLRGSPDEVFRQPDSSYFIVDDKTAKFTGTQDELFPLYEMQLNAYAYIGEHRDLKPVSGIGLIYYEPFTAIDSGSIEAFMRDTGFAMHFTPKLLKVELDFAKITKALENVRRIYELSSPPEISEGCEDCEKLGNLIGILH